MSETRRVRADGKMFERVPTAIVARVFGYLALGDSVAFLHMMYAASRLLDASPDSLVVERCDWLPMAIRLRPRLCLSVACSPTRRIVEQVLKLGWLGTLLFPTPADGEAADYGVCHGPLCRRAIAPGREYDDGYNTAPWHAPVLVALTALHTLEIPMHFVSANLTTLTDLTAPTCEVDAFGRLPPSLTRLHCRRTSEYRNQEDDRTLRLWTPLMRLQSRTLQLDRDYIPRRAWRICPQLQLHTLCVSSLRLMPDSGVLFPALATLTSTLKSGERAGSETLNAISHMGTLRGLHLTCAANMYGQCREAVSGLPLTTLVLHSSSQR